MLINGINCRHIGRLTKDRHSTIIHNAYTLNNDNQFKNYNKIKIINLERRIDRKQDNIHKMTQLNINHNEYQFVKAIDGNQLKPTSELKKLFQGNDFANRKGVIGCALSHYNLWKELLNDHHNDYYIIMEDDFTLRHDFKEQIELLKKSDEFLKRDILFLGYHMFDKHRRNHFDKYNNNSNNLQIDKLNKKLYIGGFFCYSINKSGAKILIDYIHQNGIKHGIDYLIKIVDNLESYECFPQLVFSVWNEGGKEIDSDIQNKYDSINFNNSSIISLFYINMALHFIAIKNNLCVEYEFYDEFKQIGIELFIGKNNYNLENPILLSDDNFLELIIGKPINKNVSLHCNLSCQTIDFISYLRKYFDEEFQKNNIIKNNKFKERYTNNNDVFAHVYIGDKSTIQTIDYFDKILKELVFQKGYILSDNIDHIICKLLIIKYNLIIINYNDVDTIMFSSTCKNIILSNDIYSLLIGFMAYDSHIYFPKVMNTLNSNISYFKNYKEVEYDTDYNLNVYDFFFKKHYIFIKNLDYIGSDLYCNKVDINEKFIIAYNDKNCDGFNTLGFFKKNININNLKPSKYFNNGDGLYIKRLVYENQLQKNTNYND